MTMYSTGEAAKLCDITVRTVQYWDERELVKPSEIGEGGRRSYSEEDLSRLRTVCFLKDLGFSLKDIDRLLSDPNVDGIIGTLADEQLGVLEEEIAERNARIEKLRQLKTSLKTLGAVDGGNLRSITTLMSGRKKLRDMRIWMTVIGVVIDLCILAGIALWIWLGLWWVFIACACVSVLLGILVTRYYMSHTAYICPDGLTVFRPPLSEWFFAVHTPSTRRLRCPNGGKKVDCVEVYAPASEPERIGRYLVWKEG